MLYTWWWSVCWILSDPTNQPTNRPMAPTGPTVEGGNLSKLMTLARLLRLMRRKPCSGGMWPTDWLLEKFRTYVWGKFCCWRLGGRYVSNPLKIWEKVWINCRFTMKEGWMHDVFKGCFFPFGRNMLKRCSPWLEGICLDAACDMDCWRIPLASIYDNTFRSEEISD